MPWRRCRIWQRQRGALNSPAAAALACRPHPCFHTLPCTKSGRTCSTARRSQGWGRRCTVGLRVRARAAVRARAPQRQPLSWSAGSRRRLPHRQRVPQPRSRQPRRCCPSSSSWSSRRYCRSSWSVCWIPRIAGWPGRIGSWIASAFPWTAERPGSGSMHPGAGPDSDSMLTAQRWPGPCCPLAADCACPPRPCAAAPPPCAAAAPPRWPPPCAAAPPPPENPPPEAAPPPEKPPPPCAAPPPEDLPPPPRPPRCASTSLTKLSMNTPATTAVPTPRHDVIFITWLLYPLMACEPSAIRAEAAPRTQPSAPRPAASPETSNPRSRAQDSSRKTAPRTAARPWPSCR